MPPIDPPTWDDAQLEDGRKKSMAVFSKERLEEPLEDYLEAFDEYQGHVEDLLETTVDLTDLQTSAIEIISNKKLIEVFRYLAAPPISTDDLKVLAEVTSFQKKKLVNDPDMVQRALGVVTQILDRRRFIWVSEGREPTEAERASAVQATAALIAASKTQTKRRNTGKNQQEAAVKQALRDMGFTEVPSRRIATLNQAPAPGEFCGESVLGTRKGDIIVGLWDQRVMPIECKVSNSSTNSVKRLNNDAAVKAVRWREDFGRLQVVPSAVLGGVYKLHNLREAESRGLTLFWAHDLKQLTDWIAKAK